MKDMNNTELVIKNIAGTVVPEKLISMQAKLTLTSQLYLKVFTLFIS